MSLGSGTPRGGRRAWAISTSALALLGLALPADAAVREDWYLATRNHVESGLSILLVTRDDGSRWIRLLDLSMLEIDSQAVQRSSHAGEAIASLESLPVSMVLDELGGRAHFLDGTSTHLPDLGTPELLLDVTVNGQVVREPQLVLIEDGELLLSPETLAAAGALNVQSVRADGLVPVHALAGESFVVDPGQMRLELTLPPDRFATTTLKVGDDAARSTGAGSPAPLAAIVGYDATVSRATDGSLHGAALADVAVSRGRIGCRSRHLWQDEGGTDRLDSNCTIDWPERAMSLAVGDGATRATGLSAPIRYGGVRFGTDYALQPYLYTQPVLELDGTARLPSVLEVWIEQQLALRTDLPPGPFELDNIPLLSGRGNVEAVVIDALGRRTVITQAFYSDPVLLRPGLSDWAVEIGAPRVGFDGDAYGDPFGLVNFKRGMNDWLTIEAHGEWRDAGYAAGVGGYFNLAGFGVLELGTMQTSSASGSGTAHVVGYTWRGGDWGFGLRHVARDAGYTDLAWPLPGMAPRRESRIGAGVRVGKASVAVNAVAIEDGAGDERALATAGVSVPVGPGYLSVTATRAIEPRSETRFNASYTLPLSHRDSVGARAGYSDDGVTGGLQYQRSPPLGPGYGVRAAVERQENGTSAALDAVLRSDHAEADASVFYDRSGVSLRAGASGALVVTGTVCSQRRTTAGVLPWCHCRLLTRACCTTTRSSRRPTRGAGRWSAVSASSNATASQWTSATCR